MDSAGYQVHWLDPESSTDSRGVHTLALIKLNGACTQPLYGVADNAASLDSWLGSTVVSEGHVSPFMSVNCGLVASMLVKALESLPPVRRAQLSGRAAGRVIAHEIYHMLADSVEHTTKGVAKASFNSADLLAGKLAFTSTALRRLRPLQPMARHVATSAMPRF